MKKLFGPVVFVCMLLSWSTGLRAQAVYTADKSPRLQLGGGAMYLYTDFAKYTDEGVSAWLDANLTNFLGLEAEYHLGSVISSSDYVENSYFVGPRISVPAGKAQLYGKAMIGRGEFIYDRRNVGYTKTSNAYALGVGLDYRASHHINVRVFDAEYQNWSDFKPRGLSPYAISAGVMYIIH